MHDFDFDLQLFAEGGDGSGEGAGPAAGTTGENNAPDAGGLKKDQKPFVYYGKKPQQPPAEIQTPAPEQKTEEQQPTEEEFDELIKGRYKDLFDKRVQGILSQRFKANKAKDDANKARDARLAKLEPMAEQLAAKYKLLGDGDVDLDAVAAAMKKDDDFVSREADERGLSNDTVRELRELQATRRERDALKKQVDAIQQKQAQTEMERQAFAKLQGQAQEVKKIYPSFDLGAELKNETFARLIAAHFDCRQAYEFAHKDELVRSGMQFAAQTAAQQVSDAVQANGRRPTENGVGNASGGVVWVDDPRKLTREQRKDLRQRVRRGEKVVW